jgi:hypothetical protein
MKAVLKSKINNKKQNQPTEQPILSTTSDFYLSYLTLITQVVDNVMYVAADADTLALFMLGVAALNALRLQLGATGFGVCNGFGV